MANRKGDSKMSRSNVDIHDFARAARGGQPFKFIRVDNEGFKPFATFSRVINSAGKTIFVDLYPEAVRDFLASNENELFLDVPTTVRGADGKIRDMYPTSELQKAEKAFAKLQPKAKGLSLAPHAA
ncbi:MAG: hypothetical protein R3D88_01010 [Alphaproteobacteria bacterium]